MVRFLAVCSALFLLAGLGVFLFAPADAPQAPVTSALGGPVRAAPPSHRGQVRLAFLDETGSAATETAFRGQVTLVNIWATWCTPCVEELGELAQLQQSLGGPRFRVATMATDLSDPAKARAFLDRHGAQALPPLVRASMTPSAAMLPTSVLLDAKGRVAWMGFAPRPWMAKETREALAALIAE